MSEALSLSIPQHRTSVVAPETLTPILIDEAKCSRLTGLSRRTIFTLRATGEIPHFKIRGKVL